MFGSNRFSVSVRAFASPPDNQSISVSRVIKWLYVTALWARQFAWRMLFYYTCLLTFSKSANVFELCVVNPSQSCMLQLSSLVLRQRDLSWPLPGLLKPIALSAFMLFLMCSITLTPTSHATNACVLLIWAYPACCSCPALCWGKHNNGHYLESSILSHCQTWSAGFHWWLSW